MNKVIIFILFFILTIATAFAKSTDDCIKAIETKYQSTNAISAKFVQTTFVTLTKQNITRNGLFYFQKPDNFRIEYIPPLQRVYSSDGKYLYIYSGDKSDLVTEPLTDETIPSTAYTFLKGFENLAKHFKVKKSEKFKDSEDLCSLKLTPKNKTSFDFLDVLFGENNLLSEIIINNKSGNTSHYKFNNIHSKKKLPDNLFIP